MLFLCFVDVMLLFISRSNYFYLGLPQTVLRALGDWAHLAYDAAVLLTDSKLSYSVIRYWHLYHMDESAMMSDIIVRKFIKHSGFSSIGRAISLVPLLNVSASVPVMTVYGTQVLCQWHKSHVIERKLTFFSPRDR